MVYMEKFTIDWRPAGSFPRYTADGRDISLQCTPSDHGEEQGQGLPHDLCLRSAVGGAIAGASGASAVSFVLPGAVSMPVFLGVGFGMLMVASVVGMAVAFGLTLVMDSDL